MANIKIKGEIGLLIDITETEARLAFKPGASEREWSVESLAALIQRKGVPGVGRQGLEFFLAKAASSRTAFAIMIACGLLPKPTLAERAEWTNSPLPDDLRESAERRLKTSPPPDLPGGPYDPRVLGSAYVMSGQAIGSVQPAQSGQNGKNVFGKAIPAPRPEGAALLLDPSISRIGKELFAARDGILRYGNAWADIVPFRKPDWSLRKSSDGTGVALAYDPGDPPGPVPDPKDILAKAKEMGCDKDGLIDASALARVLETAAKENHPFHGYYLTQNADAAAEIEISPDRMKASLRLMKPKGRGRPLGFQGINDLIKAKGVKVRDPERLQEDVAAFLKGPQSELKEYILAEGRPAEKSAERKATFLSPSLPDKETEALRRRLAELEPTLQGLKGLDEYPLLAFQKAWSAEEGKAVLSLPKAEPAEAGVDALGKTIPPIPGAAPVIRCYDNVHFVFDSAMPTVSGVLLYAESDGVIRLRALAYRDAEASVAISADELSAEISLFPELGIGKPLTLELAMEALKNAGVVHGIDAEAVKEGIKETENSKTDKPIVRKVAQGKPPRAPAARKIDWQIKLATGKGVTLRATGKADYRNQDKLTTVKEGETIAILHRQEDPGEPGLNVRGKRIDPPKPPSGDGLPHDASVREESGGEGLTRLIAAKSGELSFERDVLSIRAAFSVKGDVDMKTGNLRFPGNVTVSGSVASGFLLISGGDVAIGEGTEDAIVSSGGSIRIGLGIKGRGKGVIRAAKTIEILFAENATLLATEDIRIRNACVSCEVKTNGKLRLLTEKGRLLGGEVKARHGVDAQSIGSDSYVRTTVSFGQDYLVLARLEAEQREIDKVKLALLDFERRMRDAEKEGGELLAKLRQDKAKLLKILEKRHLRFWTLDDKFETHFPSEIRVRGDIHPGVVLESHNRRLEIDQRKSKVRFFFDLTRGKIVEEKI